MYGVTDILRSLYWVNSRLYRWQVARTRPQNSVHQPRHFPDVRPAASLQHTPYTQPCTEADIADAFKSVEAVTRFHEVTGALSRGTIDQRLLPNTRQTGMKVLRYQLLPHKCLTPHSSHDSRRECNSVLYLPQQQDHRLHATRPRCGKCLQLSEASIKSGD
jgi:hypothetical protein